MKFRTLFAACAIALLGSSAMANPDFWRREWPDTDFSKTSIEDWREIMSGGPAMDGSRAISNPSFIAVFDETRLGDREPVISVEIDGEVPRTYPIRYLIQHEIVNDDIGDVPVGVTFCPLCTPALVFERRVNG